MLPVGESTQFLKTFGGIRQSSGETDLMKHPPTLPFMSQGRDRDSLSTQYTLGAMEYTSSTAVMLKVCEKKTSWREHRAYRVTCKLG